MVAIDMPLLTHVSLMTPGTHLRQLGRDQLVGDGCEVRIALREVAPLLVSGVVGDQHLCVCARADDESLRSETE